jgi:hypothetical protein
MDEDFRKVTDAIMRFEVNDDAGVTAIVARRQAWFNAKEILLATLNTLVKGAPKSRRGLYVSSGAAFEHFDGVQLGFGSVPTGITRRTSSSTSLGVESGPTLVFGQSESGLVVALRYPAETTLPDERRSNAPNEFIEALEPAAISRELILKIATEFFEWAPTVILNGSIAGGRRPIGFSPDGSLWRPGSRASGGLAGGSRRASIEHHRRGRSHPVSPLTRTGDAEYRWELHPMECRPPAWPSVTASLHHQSW